jgi:patatin-like phospholipase/acyl hydrolase
MVRNDKKKIVNILSIDGGGIRGVIPAKLLKHIEEQLGDDISKHFDIIAGTSTGGLLALGLSTPNKKNEPMYKANELLNLYKTRGKDIFFKDFKYKLKSGFGLWGAQFSSKGMKTVSNEYFKDTKMSQCLTNTLITSYGIKSDHPVYFTNFKALTRPDYWEYNIKDIARATGAAPTFFNPVSVVNKKMQKHILIDGGIVRNNPTAAAISYAKQLYPNAEQFNILSLGTGRTITSNKYKKAGLLQWLPNILEYIMDGSSESTHYELSESFKSMEESSIHNGSCYLRLQPIIKKEDNDMTNFSKTNLNNLENYADDIIKSEALKIEEFINKILKKE